MSKNIDIDSPFGFDQQDDFSISQPPSSDSYDSQQKQANITTHLSESPKTLSGNIEQQSDHQYIQESKVFETGEIGNQQSNSNLEDIRLDNKVEDDQTNKEKVKLQNKSQFNQQNDEQEQKDYKTKSKKKGIKKQQKYQKQLHSDEPLIKKQIQTNQQNLIGQLNKQPHPYYENQKINESFTDLCLKSSSSISQYQINSFQNLDELQITQEIDYWIPEYEILYKEIFRFLKRESMWKQFYKQSPNILVYLFCNYTVNQDESSWLDIVQLLNQKYKQMENNWKKQFKLSSIISFKRDHVDKNLFNSQWISQDINQSVKSYKLMNFNNICKNERITFDFKQTENFEKVQSQFDNLLKDPLITQESRKLIQSLQYIVERMEYHKKKGLTKKTISFDQDDIKDLCECNQNIKEQFDKIYQQINQPSQLFLKLIKGNIQTKISQKGKKKKNTLECLKDLIRKVLRKLEDQ
ncbi:unnamed protein product [Paramecium sonneborni]|uniref:Uncharacterized protein n=1 Tax=Paramecium sonneborni TaxID=65129 RepID=A0A8S1QNQ2_9CILI|nr:unnamed protein product [Paramecium sonneborni]